MDIEIPAQLYELLLTETAKTGFAIAESALKFYLERDENDVD